MSRVRSSHGVGPGRSGYIASMTDSGSVEAIHIAAAAEAPMTSLERVRANAGIGLEGDRYAVRAGTWTAVPCRRDRVRGDPAVRALPALDRFSRQADPPAARPSGGAPGENPDVGRDRSRRGGCAARLSASHGGHVLPGDRAVRA